MGYIHKNLYSDEHRKHISEALKRKGIVPPSRKGIYKNGKPFDRKAYMKVYNKKYYAKNPEFHRERTRKYYREQCPEKRKEYQRNYLLKRNKVDIDFRLKLLFRRRVYAAIKNSYGIKAYKTMELIGCSIQDCRLHLEKQFKDGMSWDNYGMFGWHIDHIIPLDYFDLTKPEEQKKAFHYTNLQPLFCEENLKKGNKIMRGEDIV